MVSFEKRLAKVEETLQTHLNEAGEIRKAIKNLETSVQKISDRMWAAMFYSIGTLVAAVGFLLKVTLWK